MLRPAIAGSALLVALSARGLAGEPPAGAPPPPPSIPVVAARVDTGELAGQALLTANPEGIHRAVDRVVDVLSRGGDGAREFRASLERALLASAGERQAMFEALVRLAKTGPAEAEWAKQVADAGGPLPSQRLRAALEPRGVRVRYFDVKELLGAGTLTRESTLALVRAEVGGAEDRAGLKNGVLIVRATPAELDAVQAKLEALRAPR